MRKIFATMFMAVMASVSLTAIAGTPIKVSELPEASQAFIAQHFPGDNVRKAEKDNGRRGVEYEVDMTSGAEMEFMSDGNWKEVKAARGAAVPAAIVPEGIANYVAKTFSGTYIIEIARKRGGYEVELSNKTELRLTEEGQPMPSMERRRHR